MSGSIPALFSPNYVTAANRTCVIMSDDVTLPHLSFVISSLKSHRSELSFPPWEKIWCTRRATALTGQCGCVTASW